MCPSSADARQDAPARGLLVTGTDTGVGKTILSAALLAAMRSEGLNVRAHKPVVTGLDDPTASALDSSLGGWPPDHELLGRVAGMPAGEVAPHRYGPAVSPHLAAALAGELPDPSRMLADALAAIEAVGPPPGLTVVEGVGGLLAPLAADYTVLDFAVELGLPVLIAARPGLGTINHTLLTLWTARAAGLNVRAVVLTPWPERPAEMERSNRDTIASLGDVEVEVLGLVATAEPSDLARAGARLPWRRWVAPDALAEAAPALDD
jgi:dethiobiotin synthetase